MSDASPRAVRTEVVSAYTALLRVSVQATDTAHLTPESLRKDEENGPLQTRLRAMLAGGDAASSILCIARIRSTYQFNFKHEAWVMDTPAQVALIQQAVRYARLAPARHERKMGKLVRGAVLEARHQGPMGPDMAPDKHDKQAAHVQAQLNPLRS